MKKKPVTPLLRPPFIALFLIIISIVLHYNFPILKLINFPYNLFGISGIVIGLWLAFWGRMTFEKNGTPVIPGEKPKVVVSTGPFNFTRNPMYLGFLISLLGLSVILGSLVSFIAPIGFFLIINLFMIPFEEILMEKTLGKKYNVYKSKVRRWI